MKTIKVEVCACNECILMGAYSINDSVESLKKLKSPSKVHAHIQLEMDKRICSHPRKENCPVVRIDGEVMEKTDSQTVMEKIIQISKVK